jgi:hypothetical protein
VKKLIAGVGTVGAAAVSMLLFGTGVAAADDYAGQTYADASAAAGDAGLTAVVASRTGSKLSEDDCLVERSQTAPFTSANDGAVIEGNIQFYLNCDGAYATATSPGKSVASPEGGAAKSAADEEEAAAEAEAAAAQNEQDELADAGALPGATGTGTIPEG